MENNFNHTAARFGILGVNPYGPSWMDKAIETAQGVSNVFKGFGTSRESMARSKKAELENEILKQTMGSLINKENVTNDTLAQYLPWEKQAGLGIQHAQIGNIGAQTNMHNAQAREALARMGLLGAQTNYERMRTGLGLPGMMAMGGGSPLEIMQSIKDPRFESNRSGAGGTYRNPQTGQVISTDTPSMTTADQTAIAGVERVKPIISDLIKNLPQFQRANVKAKAFAEGLGNQFLGTNYELPSQLAAGEADLALAPEALIKGYGLRVTDKALEMTQKIVKPMRGESPQQYEKRILGTLKKISESEDQSRNRLEAGIDITPKQNKENQSQIQMPAFNSREEFQSWLQKLPPDQRDAVRVKLGGK